MTAQTRLEASEGPDGAAVAGYAVRRARAALFEVPGPGGVPVTPAASLDELVGPDGAVRPAGRDLAASVDLLGTTGLLARRAQVRRLVEDDGVTYGTPDDAGDDEAVDEPAGALRERARPQRRWQLDPLPVVLEADEWAGLAPGLAQRAELLDAVLADLYGRRALLHEGVVPAQVVLGHPGFLRPADQVRTPGKRSLFLSATDLGRGPDGAWRVLADRTQAPSGAGYAMENRRVVSRVLPGLYRDTPLERLRAFFHTVRAALEEAAPEGVEAPRVVLLTPGAQSETAFDQAFLATLLGYPLVEGQDLTVREGRVWMRSVGRLEPVDVVLRRVDAAWSDPLELRPDSRLGVPGLLEAARTGAVAVVNPLGAGVLENPGLQPFLPAACRLLLGGEPALESVQTLWLGDDAARRHVLGDLDRWVVKPIGRGVGRASVFGWELSQAEREELRGRVEAYPGGWCAQEALDMSTAPVVTSRGLEARHLVLRTFAVAQGGEYRLMAGGLARVAGRAGSRFVSSSDGALAKDVWVLSPDRDGATAGGITGVADSLTLAAPAPVIPALAPRVAGDLFWLGRYAERAEGTARLLRVVDDLAEDHGRRPETVGGRALRVLLEATTHATTTYPGFAGLGSGAAPLPPPHGELMRLTVDAGRPGTLAFAVRRTAEVAHGVREQLSLDTWVVLGGIERTVADLAERAAAAAPGDEPPLQPTLARALEGLLAFAGLGAESMVRDTGWYFMDLGRRLERAVQLVAVLRAALAVGRAPGVEGLVLESVLVTGESVITFRRRFAWPASSGNAALGGAPASPAHVAAALDLLLLDRTNPRSLAYQLDRAEADLRHLPDPERNAGLDRGLRALAARLREAEPGALAAAGADGVRAGLVDLLDTLLRELSALAVEVDRAHFVHVAPLRPMPVAAPGWQQ